jgi:hypothetical protein
MLHWFTSFLLISEAQERGRNINLFYPQAWRADSEVLCGQTLKGEYLGCPSPDDKFRLFSI